MGQAVLIFDMPPLLDWWVPGLCSHIPLHIRPQMSATPSRHSSTLYLGPAMIALLCTLHPSHPRYFFMQTRLPACFVQCTMKIRLWCV